MVGYCKIINEMTVWETSSTQIKQKKKVLDSLDLYSVRVDYRRFFFSEVILAFLFFPLFRLTNITFHTFLSFSSCSRTFFSIFTYSLLSPDFLRSFFRSPFDVCICVYARFVCLI